MPADVVRWQLAIAVLALLVLAPDPALAAGGKGITVAVLDSGVDATHTELTGRVERQSYSNPLPVLPLPLPDPTDQNPDPDGQGTAMASLIAGKTLGAAPEANILDLQVSGKYTGTQLDPLTEQAAIQAMDGLLQRVANNDSTAPRIVLMSFAQPGVSDSGGSTLAQQAHGLFAAGILVIVPHGPASPLQDSKDVLVVGDHAQTCTAATLAPSAPLKPDVSEEARELLVATPRSATAPAGQGSFTGTAGAAANVAGFAAVAWEQRPNLPVSALASILRDTANDVGAPGPDACTGWGSVDESAAMAAVTQWQTPSSFASNRPAPAIFPLLVVVLVVLANLKRGT